MNIQIDDDELSIQSSSGISAASIEREVVSEDSLLSKNEANNLVRKETQVLFFVKSGVLAILLTAAVIMAIVTYRYTRGYEVERFQDSFDNEAEYIINSYHDFLVRLIWSAATMSARFTAEAMKQQPSEDPNDKSRFLQFPFLALSEFDLAAFSIVQADGITSVSYAPLLDDEERDEWESYAQDYISIANPGFERAQNDRIGIYQLDQNDAPIPAERNNISSPVWQQFPVTSHDKSLLFDILSDPQKKTSLDAMLTMKSVVPGNFLSEDIKYVFHEGLDWSPRTHVFTPVFDTPDGNQVKGVVTLELDWMAFFDRLLQQVSGHLDVVIDNGNCGGIVSVCLTPDKANLFGRGDKHDHQFGQHFKESNSGSIHGHLFKLASGGALTLSSGKQELFSKIVGTGSTGHKGVLPPGFCSHTLRVYPTERFEAQFMTSRPRIYAISVVVIFIFAAVVFFSYDYIVERRQRIVMDNAVSSRAIIDSLFPSKFRDRLLGSTKGGISKLAFESRIHRDDSAFRKKLSPKIHLTTFLKHHAHRDVLTDSSQSEPIAEVFHDTTIIFADIAGFTAWSSEREPSQVFLLLETVYSAFDKIARRLGVFKVETIGDCYVAVTGLPDPNQDHAVVMARFARECICSMNELTRELEVVLGPGTSDLQIRVGLHSGPVTAGVLRGEKSRFQLFGDTMNTASRMESLGRPSRIQISAATADIITAAGKAHWLTPRHDRIDAKGKGLLQTYWCDPSHRRHKSSVSKASSSHSVVSDGWEDLTVGDPSNDEAKNERLIEWNTDVLLGQLAKVVATNNAVNRRRKRSKKQRFVDESSHGTSRSFSSTDVQEIVELPHFDWKLLSKCTEVDVASLDPKIRSQLRDYVARIASLYRDNSFHNFEHASHVSLSASKLMKRIISPEDFAFAQKSRRGRNVKQEMESELHYSTFGISSDALTQFCVVLGALVHDVDHTGVPNATLVKEQADVAVENNNKSVAERHSVRLALDLIEDDSFADLRACIYSNESEQNRFQQLLINIVLATDIVDSELQQLRKNRWDKAFNVDDALTGGNERAIQPEAINRKATIVIEHIIQASDVAHTMQHWHVYTYWNGKLFDEMSAAYRAGRSDSNPADFWYKGEIGFFDHYIIPLARKLKDCGVFGVSSDEVLTYALANREEWIAKGESIVAEMDERYSKVAPSTEEIV